MCFKINLCKTKKRGHELHDKTFSYCHILQLSIKKIKKNMKSLFAHLFIRVANNSNVMAKWHWCQMMMTMM
jgi:hypothetical protein